MNDEFDRHLKDRINEVFENFEDGSADEGWMLLREKYPEKDRKPFILWLWLGSVAAGLLLFSGVGLWFRHDNNLLTHTKTKASTQYSQGNAKAIVKKIPDSVVAFDGPKPQKLVEAKRVVLSAKTITSAQAKTQIVKQQTNKAIKSTFNRPQVLLKKPNKQLTSTAAKLTLKNTIVQPDNTQPVTTKMSATNTTVNDEYTSAQVNTIATVQTPVLTLPGTRDSSTTRQLIDTSAQANIVANNKASKQPEKTLPETRLIYGIYASAFASAPNGGFTSFNTGGGAYADIKLSKRLWLSTGLDILKNKFDFKTDPATMQDQLYSSPSSYQSSSSVSPITTLPGIPALSGSTTLIGYNVSLLALEVPINLKFNFGKSHNYVSAGFSAGTYITETYLATYRYISSALTIQQQSLTNQYHFETFFFAKTINVAAGFELPIGSQRRLAIEPFLKYPLGEVGYNKIQFGSAGINLRFNLSSVK